MIQFIIISGSNGQDVSNMFEKIVWSGRKGAAPRSVQITLIDDDNKGRPRATVDCARGDTCVFYEDGTELFRGIIISTSQGSGRKLVIKAYDNMYYWANNMDSFSYENMKASEIFDDCRNRLGMNGGECADTAYVIPSLPKKKTTFYDVVLDALSTTYNATGLRYYISSEKGDIHLRRRAENALQWVLETGSEQSNITNYTYDKSIENIRTRVRLLSNENAVVYERTNEELEAAIGTFMEVKSVSDSYNDAQIQELVDSVFDEKGNPEQSLKVTGKGASDAISGKAVYVIIPHLNIKRTFYIDQDKHTYTRFQHTMELTLNWANDIEDAG
jgi:hypothetical protein